MGPSPAPPPAGPSAEALLDQILSLGDAQPYVVKIILAHLDDPYPDPNIIHTTLSPFLEDPTFVVKSLFSHLNLSLSSGRRRRPRTESEERYRQHRRERRRERRERRRREDPHHSRKRHRRDLDEYSPERDLDRPSRRRRRSPSNERAYSLPRRSRDRSPVDRTPPHSPREVKRERSSRDYLHDRSPRNFDRDSSPKGRRRDRSPERRAYNRSSRRDVRDDERAQLPRGNSSRTWDASPAPRGRDGPLSPRRHHASPPRKYDAPVSTHRGDDTRKGKSKIRDTASSPVRLSPDAPQQNGSLKRFPSEKDPGSSMDSKAGPKTSNRLLHLRSKVLASLSKRAEDNDGATE